MNRNIALGTLKYHFVALFTCEKGALSDLINKIVVCDKKPPRGADKIGKRERNSTEYNYKRAI